MSRTYIQLSKAGDILSLLPLLYEESKKGEKPTLVVSREYGSLLEGVSYVEAVHFDGGVSDLGSAVAFAKGINGSEVICCQVNGPKDHVYEYTYKPKGKEGASTGSFQEESWMLAGRHSEWTKNLPLTFDRRSPEREKVLVDAHIPRALKKKIVLLSSTGNSSPFPHKDLLQRLVPLIFHDCRIINLNDIKAERL